MLLGRLPDSRDSLAAIPRQQGSGSSASRTNENEQHHAIEMQESATLKAARDAHTGCANRKKKINHVPGK